MSIPKRDPNTILLGGNPGSYTLVDDLAASEAITPGMLCETAVVSSRNSWRKHSTAGGPTRSVANNMTYLNKGVDDACGVGDVIEVYELAPGCSFWGLVASGAPAILFGAKLQSAGNGLLQAFTSGLSQFRALESVDNSAGGTNARIRVEVV